MCLLPYSSFMVEKSVAIPINAALSIILSRIEEVKKPTQDIKIRCGYMAGVPGQGLQNTK